MPVVAAGVLRFAPLSRAALKVAIAAAFAAVVVQSLDQAVAGAPPRGRRGRPARPCWTWSRPWAASPWAWSWPWSAWAAPAPLLGMGAISLLCLVFVLPADLRRTKGGRYDPTVAKAYAAYGLPVALSLILALVLSTTDRFLLAAFLDEPAVGVYHAGYSASRTAPWTSSSSGWAWPADPPWSRPWSAAATPR